jgi:hypothetical protein
MKVRRSDIITGVELFEPTRAEPALDGWSGR